MKSNAVKLAVVSDLQAEEDAIIAKALAILGRRIKRGNVFASNPAAIKEYLVCSFGARDSEVFSVLWLDVKNRVIAHDIMFHGTLSHCSVYPREVVKAAMAHNAASVILVHNHPSGNPEPSESDQLLTRALTQALALVDVRVLDHFIVADTRTYSFAEHGLI